MTQRIKSRSIIILFLAFSFCNAQNDNKNLKKENVDFVIDVVENVVNDFNFRNEFLKKLNFSSPQNESNLILFDSIKNLNARIQKKTKDGLSLLRNRFEKQSSEYIFNTGIKYLEAVDKLEIVLPILLDKIQKLIMGETANGEGMDEVNKAFENHDNASNNYKKEIREYAIINNLEDD